MLVLVGAPVTSNLTDIESAELFSLESNNSELYEIMKWGPTGIKSFSILIELKGLRFLINK